jgi:formylglycine-generating enzyme required for sulfatase activity
LFGGCATVGKMALSHGKDAVKGAVKDALKDAVVDAAVQAVVAPVIEKALAKADVKAADKFAKALVMFLSGNQAKAAECFRDGLAENPDLEADKILSVIQATAPLLGKHGRKLGEFAAAMKRPSGSQVAAARDAEPEGKAEYSARPVGGRGRATLRVFSTAPRSRVYVDGTRIGTTPEDPGEPLVVSDLTPGTHDVEVKSGEAYWRGRVTLSVAKPNAAEAEPRSAAWHRAQKASLEVRTVPPGAGVKIADTSKNCKSPCRLELEPGDHTVVVTYQGGVAQRRAVHLRKGQTMRLSLNVDKDRGRDQPERDATGMVEVPAGICFLGQGRDANTREHRARLSAFRIDRHEVTVERYAKCVKNGACTVPASGDQCNWGVKGRDQHPINCVDWHQAKTYCHWAGKRLPTEAEWEKAARGTDRRPHPWGEEEPSCERAVVRVKGEAGCGRDSTWPVGSKPAGASPYGVLDMAGNVREWVADWFDEYPSGKLVEDPTGPAKGDRRVCRGTSYGPPLSPDAMPVPVAGSVSRRGSCPPTLRRSWLGFRCAADQRTTGMRQGRTE